MLSIVNCHPMILRCIFFQTPPPPGEMFFDDLEGKNIIFDTLSPKMQSFISLIQQIKAPKNSRSAKTYISYGGRGD